MFFHCLSLCVSLKSIVNLYDNQMKHWRQQLRLPREVVIVINISHGKTDSERLTFIYAI